MRLGIDTGGTYTDAVLFDSVQGVVRAAKSLTTHHDLSIGIKDVIRRIDTNDTKPLSSLIEFTSISTTLATNAIVEGHGGSICLILIGHSSDALNRAKLKDALREDPVEIIRGGHTALGEESEPLDLDEARKAIARYKNKVTAFAVAALFSVRNTEHEIAVRNLILELTDKPVTCSFELSSELNGPRRAMTTALNARLIAPISELIRTVRDELDSRQIKSPLMVVKGDGSMISADIASTRPVETILSGPAASIVGACSLSSGDIKVVSDIGGTTTDVAILQDGSPKIARDGAFVGGFRTFVEAVDVFTVGLGGDSQVSFGKPIKVGPTRALPLCALAKQHPNVIKILENQLSRPPQEYQGCFAVLRKDASDPSNLKNSEKEVWEQLKDGPIDCEVLYRDLRKFRAFLRLRTKDIASLAAFTPTDALHFLGYMNQWPTQPSNIGAQLWTRGFRRDMKAPWSDPTKFCNDVIEHVINRTSEVLIHAAIASEHETDAIRGLDQIILNKGITPSNGTETLEVKFSFSGKLAVVGAPATPFYPEVARRLNTPLEIPENSHVGNAVGAVAGGINQRVTGLITSPAEGVFRAHTPSGIQDFTNLDRAAEYVQSKLESLAILRAQQSNAANPSVSTQRDDVIVKTIGASGIFVESRISSTVSAGTLRLQANAE